MLTTNEGQRVMIDEALYPGKGPRSSLNGLLSPAKGVSGGSAPGITQKRPSITQKRPTMIFYLHPL